MPEGRDGGALERLVGFGRYLRAEGLAVGTERVLTFCRAATVVDPSDLRWAARATLVARREELAVLDEAFDRYFAGLAGQRVEPVVLPAPAVEVAAGTANLRGLGLEDEGKDGTAVRVIASDLERLRHKDFAEMTEEERRRSSSVIRRLVLAGPFRRSRRLRPAMRGRRFDLPRTLRRSLRTEGEPFRRAWRERPVRRRALVLVLDVSGSMSPYARPLVEFAHAAARAGDRVEAFCFGTRLTRITSALRTSDPERALAAVGSAVGDWEGGTRIGEALRDLLERWGHTGVLRGSVIVVCSDGLERGDPDVLATQVRRLSRLAHRVVWINPLKGSPRYEPLARGMAASLPFVDVFLPGHDLASLELLAETVAAA